MTRLRALARSETLLAPLGYAALVLLVYRYVWLGSPPRYFGWDTIESYWPDLSFLASSLSRLELPLWNPYNRGGYPFLADPQTGSLYPVNWLFAAIGALLGDVPLWLGQARALFHHALLGLLMYAYLRTRRLPAAAAAFGGAVAILSVPLIRHKASCLIWPFAWVPLVWIAIDRAVARAEEPGWWRRAIALGGAVALCGTAMSPPGFFYALVLTVPYGVFRLAPILSRARRPRLWATVGAHGRMLGVAALVAASLLAIAVLPGLELTEASARATRTEGYALQGAYGVGATLVGLVSPRSGSGAYVGVITLAFALAALVVRPRADGAAPAFFLGFAAFFLLLTFGRHAHVLPFLVKHVPGFGMFRIAERYVLSFGLVIAIPAAHALGALLEAEASCRRRVLRVLLALLAAMLVGVAITGRLASVAKNAPSSWVAVVLLVGAGLLTWLATVRGARFASALVFGLAALAVVDVAAFGGHAVRSSEKPPDHDGDARFLADLGDLAETSRFYDEFVLGDRAGSRLRLRDFRGYPAGDPLEDVRYTEVLRRASRDPAILEAFNVRWILQEPHPRTGNRHAFVKSLEKGTNPHYRRAAKRLFEAAHPAPLVAWYGRVRLVNTLRMALDALLAIESPDGRRIDAVIERDDVPAAEAPAIRRLSTTGAAAPASVAGTLLSYAPDCVTATVVAPAEGIVVLNENLRPGWRVTVDGRDATPVRTNVLLRGVRVDAGEHVIAWRYEPGLGLHWLAWGVGWLALLAAGIASVRARRRAPAAA